LDVTELGRYASARLAEAIKIRAGTCRFPTCTVPAERCDLDHHNPHPRGPTSGNNQDPFCRRHHRGKTFAWHAALRDDYGVDWTMPDAEHYRCLDEPLPTGRGAASVVQHVRLFPAPTTYLKRFVGSPGSDRHGSDPASVR
ncbi:MAG TPA: hypothetical protein VI074_05925, partial [Propionibacteriaceae bacterium]